MLAQDLRDVLAQQPQDGVDLGVGDRKVGVKRAGDHKPGGSPDMQGCFRLGLVISVLMRGVHAADIAQRRAPPDPGSGAKMSEVSG